MVDHHTSASIAFLRAFTTKQSLYSGQSLPRQLSLVLVTSGQAWESSATLAQVLISPSGV